MKRILIVTLVAGVVFSAAPASAQLMRVGPPVQANGFPAWYQDTTGIALEFCQPLNQLELDGGWCLLLPADTSVPETFPAIWAGEHFYWAGDATFTVGGIDAQLVLGLEAGFAQEVVRPGDQSVFARVRIRIDGLPNGRYLVKHPFGSDPFVVDAGEINYTEDVGIACAPGQFDCALNGRLGPFLLPSATEGGPESAPVSGPVPGKLYIAAPTREGPVTGSPVGQNYFELWRTDGTPVLVGRTGNFTLMGRLFTGAISGKVTVDRASYASAAGAPNKVDVFATAFPTTQTRLPAGPAPAVVQPVLAFFPAACIATPAGMAPPQNVAAVQMLNDGSNYHAQVAPAVVPPAVCVGDLTARDASGQAVPLFSQKAVTDQVTVTQAFYSPGAGTLSVNATSSDTLNAPVLTVLGYGAIEAGLHVTGALVAPPSKVRVASSKGGEADLLVTTGVGTSPNIPIPIAVNDEASGTEDAGAVLINVLGNDTMGGVAIDPLAATINLLGPAGMGSIAITADKQVAYTPAPNAWGNDSFAYTVTVLADGQPKTSPAAFVSIAIAPVNDVPVAANDTFSAAAGLPLTLNVLANDTDADGAADLVNTRIVTSPVNATATIGAGGAITFTAAAPGTYSFTYAAIDAAGATSAPATITVNVTGNETITIVRAEFVRSTLRWRVDGTTSLQAGQTITIAYDNGSLRPFGTSLAGFVIGTAVVSPTGAWALDLRLTSATDPRNPNATNVFVIRPNRIRVSSPLGGFTTAAIALR